MNTFSCALTGHRNLPPDFDCASLYEALKNMISKGCNYFFCGMAEGFDLTCLSLLIELKEFYHFQVEACVPYEGQPLRFSDENRLLYSDLIRKCDKITTLFPTYQDGCFFARDRYMADSADCVFAYCTRKTGGTAYTVRYAEKIGKKVYFFGC